MANQTKRKLHRVLANRLIKMISRCENPKQPDYARYGARGISVCPEWLRKDSGLASFIKHVGSELPLPHGVSLEAALAMRGAALISANSKLGLTKRSPVHCPIPTPTSRS